MKILIFKKGWAGMWDNIYSSTNEPTNYGIYNNAFQHLMGLSTDSLRELVRKLNTSVFGSQLKRKYAVRYSKSVNGTRRVSKATIVSNILKSNKIRVELDFTS